MENIKRHYTILKIEKQTSEKVGYKKSLKFFIEQDLEKKIRVQAPSEEKHKQRPGFLSDKPKAQGSWGSESERVFTAQLLTLCLQWSQDIRNHQTTGTNSVPGFTVISFSSNSG